MYITYFILYQFNISTLGTLGLHIEKSIDPVYYRLNGGWKNCIAPYSKEYIAKSSCQSNCYTRYDLNGGYIIIFIAQII